MMIVALLATALAGCGSAADVAQERDHPTPAPIPTVPTTTPPTGTYPAYPHDDYTFVLNLSCFCADRGVPSRITVEDGTVTSAVYLRNGRGHHAGDPAPKWLWITLADVIDAANDTEAAQVDVTWPAGQEYPTRVYVDQDRMMADEEIGYSVSDVVPAD
jgi:hypothetical protein